MGVGGEDSPAGVALGEHGTVGTCIAARAVTAVALGEHGTVGTCIAARAVTAALPQPVRAGSRLGSWQPPLGPSLAT